MLALRDRAALLLDLEKWAVGVLAGRRAVTLDAGFAADKDGRQKSAMTT